MNNLKIEVHTFLKDQLPRELASHILATCLNGNIAVVCSTPIRLMNQVRTEWCLLTSRKAFYYKNISFSAASPFDDIQANIAFSSAREFKLLPPMCMTLYIIESVTKQDMYLLTSWLPSHAMIVLFKEVSS